MQTPTTEELRELLLNAPESATTRVLAIALSLLLLVIVLTMVRRRTLREEYTPIWVTVALVITIISVRMDWLRALTRAIGAWTPSSTLFFLGEVFLVCISLNFAVRMSRTNVRLKELAQETAVLRARLARLESEADGS